MDERVGAREFLPAGRFTVGANYWASHAGTYMWRDWRPEIVADDLRRLASEAGLQALRVFPLWPDFQPIENLRGANAQLRDVRHGDDALVRTPQGSIDGVSSVMLDRFRVLADLAHDNGLVLIVALINGWMSGRLFAPAAVDGLNAITDPASLMWQVRMVTRIVREFRDHPAIAAWEPGNECNCMGSATRDQAWVWTAAITAAIRSADPTRPVSSGMHGLSADPSRAWCIRDQAELTDALCTHPYPIFTPHCDQDRIDSMRSVLHAATQSRLYADIGGRPAFAEEMGTLGPTLGSESASAAYARASLFSLWAHDCRAAYWWCAFDQTQLAHPPYEWTALEQELGLFRPGGEAKSVALEFGAVRRAIEELPFDALPPRSVEAVCLLTRGQDSWGAAQSAFLLAKQAGFDISFAFDDADLPESTLYLAPSLCGTDALRRHTALSLAERVRGGATLYLSVDDAFLSHFEDLTGLRIDARRRRSSPLVADFDAVAPGLKWESSSAFQYLASSTRAEVLGRETNENPILSRADYGHGQVYFLGFPLETQLSVMPGVFQDGPEMWRVYRAVASRHLAGRALTKSAAQVGITEHGVSDTQRIAVLINYEGKPIRFAVEVGTDWDVAQICRGNPAESGDGGLMVELPGLDIAVWLLSRK